MREVVGERARLPFPVLNNNAFSNNLEVNLIQGFDNSTFLTLRLRNFARREDTGGAVAQKRTRRSDELPVSALPR